MGWVGWGMGMVSLSLRFFRFFFSVGVLLRQDALFYYPRSVRDRILPSRRRDDILSSSSPSLLCHPRDLPLMPTPALCAPSHHHATSTPHLFALFLSRPKHALKPCHSPPTFHSSSVHVISLIQKYTNQLYLYLSFSPLRFLYMYSVPTRFAQMSTMHFPSSTT